jgi:oligoendopeptidase F
MSQPTGAEHIFWDLTDLYSAPDAAELQSDKKKVLEMAARFGEVWRGRIASLSSDEFLTCLNELEAIQDLGGRIGSYAYLSWSADTENPTLGKLLQEATELGSEIGQKLVFFDVEWLKTDDVTAKKHIESETLRGYRHYLEASRRYKPHTLSEEQEQMLQAKSVTGQQAWVRFFDETLGAAKFPFREEELSEQEILSKLHEPDRDIRKDASDGFTTALKGLSRTLTFVFNTLLADKKTNDALRNYPSWISARNLSNEISDATVENLVASVQAYYPVVQRYYRLKRRLLGYDKLYDYDRYAPLMQTESTVSWEEAREMVLSSYSGFHPEMGRIAGEFFEKNWIDAALRPGKRSGAYAASTVPSVHPYVFMNYTGQLRDVQTLAHELGHGVHQYLSRKNGIFQADTPLTTAETASVFGEMLVFQNITARLTDPKEKLALLMEKIDDTIATVFRQVSMNRFEHAMHTARREEGELASERLSELWFETQRALYGDSVELTDNYRNWWMYIPHFLHTPGYVYAYAFGELLVLSLYNMYQQQPQGFADRYLQLLSAGGSEWPEKLVARIGLNVEDPQFWTQGLQLFEQLVVKAEEAAAAAGLAG